MSELRTPELAAKEAPPQAPQKPATPKHLERRQMRRAGISLLVRVRTADFTDGNFEEVRTTQNASRKAVYFVTHVDRYYKGMRVRITSPYDPNNGSGNLEQTGEVVRVHRKEVGYGVAIAITSGVQAAAIPATYASASPGSTSQPSQVISTSNGSHYAQSSGAKQEQALTYGQNERRSANRAPFIAPVDLVDVRTGTRVHARTSDLSRQGCYVDTLNPLPVGSMVRVQIHRSEKLLDAIAHVSSRHAGSGMGLVFSELTSSQKGLLATWLTELALPSRAEFADPATSKSATPVAPSTSASSSTARLIQMLLRKGVLSQSEANELFSEPE